MRHLLPSKKHTPCHPERHLLPAYKHLLAMRIRITPCCPRQKSARHPKRAAASGCASPSARGCGVDCRRSALKECPTPAAGGGAAAAAAGAAGTQAAQAGSRSADVTAGRRAWGRSLALPARHLQQVPRCWEMHPTHYIQPLGTCPECLRIPNHSSTCPSLPNMLARAQTLHIKLTTICCMLSPHVKRRLPFCKKETSPLHRKGHACT